MRLLPQELALYKILKPLNIYIFSFLLLYGWLVQYCSGYLVVIMRYVHTLGHILTRLGSSSGDGS